MRRAYALSALLFTSPGFSLETPPEADFDRTFDAGAEEQATGVAVDKDGAAVLVGFRSDPAKPALNFLDPFAVKFSSTGALIWTIAFDGGANETAEGVAVDEEGNP